MSNTVAVGIDDQLHQFRFKPAAKSGSKKRKNTSKAALEHVKAEQSDFAKPVSTALVHKSLIDRSKVTRLWCATAWMDLT